MEVDGEFRFHLEGNAGNERFIGGLTSIDDSTGNFAITILAGSGNDTVTFGLNIGFVPTVTFNPADTVLIDGGLGNDTLTNLAGGLVTGLFFEAINS